MRDLVFANRHQVGAVHRHVGGLEQRIAKKSN